MIRNLLLIVMLGAVAAGTTACNTVKGFGRDVQSVGEAGERAL